MPNQPALDVHPSDLDLAFRRLCDGYARTVPCPHPLALDVVRPHSVEWLALLAEALSAGTYVPGAPFPLEMPKSDWQSRPMLRLTLEDQLVYQYIGLRILRTIGPGLAWSERSVRFSYHFNLEGHQWFRESGTFRGWLNFDRVAVAKLQHEFQFVVTTDLAAYYENIDIGQLAKDLRADAVDPAVVSLLSACLNKWAGARQRGIPQSFSPSHLLGEYYLNEVDRALAAEGHSHIRYLDDVRVFARTEADARRALRRVNELVRGRGLNLQSAKTKILSAEDGRSQFRQVHGALNKVARDIARVLQVLAKHGYASPEEVAQFTRDMDPSEPNEHLLVPTWQQFESERLGPFDKTLFHYLLTRLADVGSAAAVPFVLSTLHSRPEETEYCLKYLSALMPLSSDTIDGLASILTSGDTIYEFQRWQILRWFEHHTIPHETVRSFARSNVSARTTLRLLRPLSILYLGAVAESRHDYDRIRDAINEEPDKDIKACLLVALARGPKEVYGTDLTRATGESKFLDWCVQYARAEAAAGRKPQRPG